MSALDKYPRCRLSIRPTAVITRESLNPRNWVGKYPISED